MPDCGRAMVLSSIMMAIGGGRRGSREPRLRRVARRPAGRQRSGGGSDVADAVEVVVDEAAADAVVSGAGVARERGRRGGLRTAPPNRRRRRRWPGPRSRRRRSPLSGGRPDLPDQAPLALLGSFQHNCGCRPAPDDGSLRRRRFQRPCAALGQDAGYPTVHGRCYGGWGLPKRIGVDEAGGSRREKAGPARPARIPQASVQEGAVTAFLQGKSILITGGTGFVRQALRVNGPGRAGSPAIVIFSRDERSSTSPAGDRLGSKSPVPLGDVRECERLLRASISRDSRGRRALKQVPAAENDPFEAVKTNINGARNVIDAALDRGVSRVIALSTDKASSPISLYERRVVGGSARRRQRVRRASQRLGSACSLRQRRRQPGERGPAVRRLAATGRIPITASG